MPYSPSLIAPVILFSSLILPMGQKGQKYNSTTWSLTIVLRQFAIRSLTTKHWALVTRAGFRLPGARGHKYFWAPPRGEQPIFLVLNFTIF